MKLKRILPVTTAAVAALVFSVSNRGSAQTDFTYINAGLPGVSDGAAVWCDYDNDGRLDILLTGITKINSAGVLPAG